MKTVYLAGPINNLSYAEATGWREYATAYLRTHGIVGLSPMRFKDFLRGELKITDSYEEFALASERGITTRDRNDVLTSDVVLANFLGGVTKVSCGTPIEFGWADAWRKPVVMVMEPEGNPFDHPMMRTIAGYRVTTLDEGLHIVVALLNGG